MRFLVRITTKFEATPTEDVFPFSVPWVSTFDGMEIPSEVLFLVGENGSGKSTLLEALAIASRRIAVGGAPLDRDPTLDAVRPLADRLRLAWARQTGKGFFLRAEDFFNYAKRQRETAGDLQNLADSYDDPRVRGYIAGQAHAMRDRYQGDLDARSHGESFLAFFQSRVVPGGLYLIDEPEAALSPRRQLTLLSLMRASVEEHECQFIIATHSPILLSYPGATLWDFDGETIEPKAFEELEHVRLTRDFLACPERYWRHL